MLRLMNLTNHPKDLARFGSCPKTLQAFLDRNQLHGIELMLQEEWSETVLSKAMAKGAHMCFWPIWLDFWRNDRSKLIAQFKTEEAIRQFYGGLKREAMVAWYKRELSAAAALGVQYVVFHVSHVTLEDCYKYHFNYSNEEIAEAFIALVNEVFEGFDGELLLLMENQWWPGLTLLDASVMERLMEGIKYPHKGFMLDIGHMMNTNTQLSTELEAVAYIQSQLSALGDSAQWIKGIHLNSSLSGDYVETIRKTGGDFKPEDSFFDQYMQAFGHIGQIDRHEPFKASQIRQVVEQVQPAFLVHEFTVQDVAQLETYLQIQNRALGLSE